VLQALAGSVGAGLAAPALVKGAPAHAHASAPAAAEAPAGAALPGMLDASEREMLKSLAEAILPGSTEAGVASFVDQLLAVDTQARQRDFLSALGAIQAEALGQFGKSWTSLDTAQQTQVLTAASSGPPSRTPRYWKPGEPVVIEEPPKVEPTLRDRFDLIKERVATAYYSSEKGMKELGWTGQMVHPSFPGCTHAEGHAAEV
jgi:hypothetical protein